jgi:hypothetical protein
MVAAYACSVLNWCCFNKTLYASSAHCRRKTHLAKTRHICGSLGSIRREWALLVMRRLRETGPSSPVGGDRDSCDKGVVVLVHEAAWRMMGFDGRRATGKRAGMRHERAALWSIPI